MLKTFLKNKKEKKAAFTLIEIVVVIAIMGILSTIIYSSFDASRAKSRDQKRVSDISTIQLALEQYFNKHGVYPLTLDTLVNPPSPENPYINAIPSPASIGETPYQNNYFPITKTSGSDNCVSYQLWTTFEKSNSYLDSKKGFNSTDSGLPSNLYECGKDIVDHASAKIEASSTVNVLVYDVMP